MCPDEPPSPKPCDQDLPEASPATDVHLRLFGHTFNISRFTFLLVLGAVIGVITGLAAVAFRTAALGGEHLFFPDAEEGSNTFSAVRRLFMPALGGLICGLVLYRVAHFTGGHSIPAILRAVATGQSYFKLRMALPAALSTITLASGGSVGPEGPIAEIGSVAGSLVGRWCKLPPRLMKPLIGSGVAAGIAAVFNAPIAGVFFAIEVILRNYEVASFTPIAVAAVVASVVSHAMLGEHMAIVFPSGLPIPVGELPFFAILGVICGLLSLLYIHVLDYSNKLFAKIKIPLWIKPALGGLMVGATGFFFPNVMGEGYAFLQEVIDGGAINVWLLLALVFFKMIATGFSLGSGSPGGSFAPAVFIGVVGGAAFGQMLGGFGWVETPHAFAAMGVSGMIAGALGAPVTAIMMAMRQGMNQPQLLLPVMTTVAFSVFMMQRSRGVSVYTLGFLRKGIDLDHTPSDPLSIVQVSAFTHKSDFAELPASMLVKEALQRLRDRDEHFYVVRDEGGDFAGIVSLHEMRLAIAEEELANLLVLADLTDPMMPRLQSDMNLKDTLSAFSSSDAEVLPVFEQRAELKTFIGVISRQDALDAYQHMLDAM